MGESSEVWERERQTEFWNSGVIQNSANSESMGFCIYSESSDRLRVGTWKCWCRHIWNHGVICALMFLKYICKTILTHLKHLCHEPWNWYMKLPRKLSRCCWCPFQYFSTIILLDGLQNCFITYPRSADPSDRFVEWTLLYYDLFVSHWRFFQSSWASVGSLLGSNPFVEYLQVGCLSVCISAMRLFAFVLDL